MDDSPTRGPQPGKEDWNPRSREPDHKHELDGRNIQRDAGTAGYRRTTPSLPYGSEAGARGRSMEFNSVGGLESPRHERATWVPEPTVTIEEDEGIDWNAVAVTCLLALGVFLLALLPRLIFLYVVTDPNTLIPSWSNDTWHRWQIAYFSKEIGLADGLRLWDLKGLEYYWGVLHPFLLAGLFGLLGTVDIMVLRWLTLIAGALNIVFLFLIGRRFWGVKVGFVIALLIALNPIVIFNDPSGMVEPLGFLFLLAGIYFYPRRAGLAGVLWALAAMSRAEAWLLSLGLVVVAMFGKENTYRKLALGVGWAIPILVYMKYLLDRTGNAIYPIYWNFLANAAGRWEFREEFTSYQLAVRPVFAVLFAICVAGAIWAFLKRPKGYLLYMLGFGSSAFITGFIGLTFYLKSYEPWFWMTRFFVFPYMFLLLLAVVFLQDWLPGKVKLWRRLRAGTFCVFILFVVTQLAWPSVLYDVEEGYTSITSVVGLQTQGQFIDEYYEGGTVLIPEGVPQFTYALGRYSSIPARNILGQMYGPIYYYEGENPFDDWETVGPLMWNWFRGNDVRILVMNSGDERFTRMIDESPESFEHLGTVPGSGLMTYEVSLR